MVSTGWGHGPSDDPREKPTLEFERQLAAVRQNAPLVWEQMAKAHIELRHIHEERHRNRVAALYAAAIFAGCTLGAVLLGWAGLI